MNAANSNKYNILFIPFIMFCFLSRSSVRFTFRDGHLPPFSSVGRGLSSASSTHDADILAQPNATLLKTNIRNTVFIIRLSLFRRTTPVPESTVNAENTNGRGPRGLSPNVLSLLIIYRFFRSLAQTPPSSSLFLILTPFLTLRLQAAANALLFIAKYPLRASRPVFSQRTDTEKYNRKQPPKTPLPIIL